MRSGTEVVHLGGCGSPVLSSLLHQGVNFVWRPDCPFTESFHEDSLFLVFSNLQLRPVDLQQIRDDLVVDLEVADSDHEGGVLAGLHLNKLEYLFHASGDYTSLGVTNIVLKPFHGVGLSCACLPVGDDCRVITFENGDDTVLSCVVVDKFLR